MKSSEVEVEILVSLMTSLVAGKVATGVDPMCTAKINNSPGFKFQNLTISYTSLFNALLNLLQNDDFVTGCCCL